MKKLQEQKSKLAITHDSDVALLQLYNNSFQLLLLESYITMALDKAVNINL